VKSFYDLAFNQRQPEQAVAKYVGTSYRQRGHHVVSLPTWELEQKASTQPAATVFDRQHGSD